MINNRKFHYFKLPKYRLMKTYLLFCLLLLGCSPVNPTTQNNLVSNSRATSSLDVDNDTFTKDFSQDQPKPIYSSPVNSPQNQNDLMVKPKELSVVLQQYYPKNLPGQYWIYSRTYTDPSTPSGAIEYQYPFMLIRGSNSYREMIALEHMTPNPLQSITPDKIQDIVDPYKLPMGPLFNANNYLGDLNYEGQDIFMILDKKVIAERFLIEPLKFNNPFQSQLKRLWFVKGQGVVKFETLGEKEPLRAVYTLAQYDQGAESPDIIFNKPDFLPLNHILIAQDSKREYKYKYFLINADQPVEKKYISANEFKIFDILQSENQFISTIYRTDEHKNTLDTFYFINYDGKKQKKIFNVTYPAIDLNDLDKEKVWWSQEINPTLSPQKNKVVYGVEVAYGSQNFSTIVVKDNKGKNRQLLPLINNSFSPEFARNSEFNWTNNEKYIFACLSYATYVYKIASDGSSYEIINNISCPQVSNRGDQIVYYLRKENQIESHLIVENIEIKEKKLIIPKNMSISKIIWSPDDQKILLQSWNDFYILDLNSKKIKQITDSEKEKEKFSVLYYTNPIWSPDSSKIAFCVQRYDYIDTFTIDVNGNNLKYISEGSPVLWH